MIELKGTISISKVSRSHGDDYIQIQLEDDTSTNRVVAIEISPEQFALALTGLGCTPCKFVFNDSGTVGSTREHKSIAIIIPDESRWNLDKDEVAQPLVKPYEIDGWRANLRDLRNHHGDTKVGGRAARKVLFTRFLKDGIPIPH